MNTLIVTAGGVNVGDGTFETDARPFPFTVEFDGGRLTVGQFDYDDAAATDDDRLAHLGVMDAHVRSVVASLGFTDVAVEWVFGA